jgi:hypothetical protein
MASLHLAFSQSLVVVGATFYSSSSSCFRQAIDTRLVPSRIPIRASYTVSPVLNVDTAQPHLAIPFYLSGLYCRGARRELGLIRHACLAFMLVGDDGLGHADRGDRETERFHRF